MKIARWEKNTLAASLAVICYALLWAISANFIEVGYFYVMAEALIWALICAVLICGLVAGIYLLVAANQNETK